MPTSIEFPGPDFPAYPKVTLTCPDDWAALPIPEVLVAASKQSPEGEFRPNVVVAVTRYSAGFQLGEAVAAVAAKLASLESHELVVDEEAEAAGYPAHRTEVTFSDPRVGTLAQAVYLVAVQNGGYVDLLQVTGSCSASQIEGTFGEIREILATVSISA
jgi:hypothetical protein